MQKKTKFYKRTSTLTCWHTYFHTVRCDAGHSWRGRLCFSLSIWWGADRAGFSAGNRQADLFPGHLRALQSTVRLRILLSGGPLVAQIADLHDVANDLYGSGDCLLTGGDVVLHLLQVRRRSPALFILVPAILIDFCLLILPKCPELNYLYQKFSSKEYIFFYVYV